VQPNDDRQSQPGVAVRRTQLAVRLDPLGRQYGMGFETVCQRLSTLQGRKSLKATGDHGISFQPPAWAAILPTPSPRSV
jgi:hypothetical protein